MSLVINNILVKDVYVPFDRFLSSVKCLEIFLVGEWLSLASALRILVPFGSWDFISSRGAFVLFSDITSQLITYLTSFQVDKYTQ